MDVQMKEEEPSSEWPQLAQQQYLLGSRSALKLALSTKIPSRNVMRIIRSYRLRQQPASSTRMECLTDKQFFDWKHKIYLQVASAEQVLIFDLTKQITCNEDGLVWSKALGELIDSGVQSTEQDLLPKQKAEKRVILTNFNQAKFVEQLLRQKGQPKMIIDKVSQVAGCNHSSGVQQLAVVPWTASQNSTTPSKKNKMPATGLSASPKAGPSLEPGGQSQQQPSTSAIKKFHMVDFQVWEDSGLVSKSYFLLLQNGQLVYVTQHVDMTPTSMTPGSLEHFYFNDQLFSSLATSSLGSPETRSLFKEKVLLRASAGFIPITDFYLKENQGVLVAFGDTLISFSFDVSGSANTVSFQSFFTFPTKTQINFIRMFSPPSTPEDPRPLQVVVIRDRKVFTVFDLEEADSSSGVFAQLVPRVDVALPVRSLQNAFSCTKIAGRGFLVSVDGSVSGVFQNSKLEHAIHEIFIDRCRRQVSQVKKLSLVQGGEQGSKFSALCQILFLDGTNTFARLQYAEDSLKVNLCSTFYQTVSFKHLEAGTPEKEQEIPDKVDAFFALKNVVEIEDQQNLYSVGSSSTAFRSLVNIGVAQVTLGHNEPRCILFSDVQNVQELRPLAQLQELPEESIQTSLFRHLWLVRLGIFRNFEHLLEVGNSILLKIEKDFKEDGSTVSNTTLRDFRSMVQLQMNATWFLAKEELIFMSEAQEQPQWIVYYEGLRGQQQWVNEKIMQLQEC